MYKQVTEKSVNGLFALPHVVGVGYGFKEVGRKLTSKRAVVVMVSKKVPLTSLAKHQVVPKIIEGVASDVVEVGRIVARSNTTAAAKTLYAAKSRRSRWRPAPGGVSIGHYQITAGTLGAVVRDKVTGKRLILSNNHVLANSTNGRDGRAKIGDPILQPGPLDGGTIRHDTIAKLYRFVPLRNKSFNVVDAAVAVPLSPCLVTPFILKIGYPQGITCPRLGMKVKKSGRTTGLTFGRIQAVNTTIKVDYDGRILKFKHQIVVTVFDKGGDSGSLVVDKCNRAVGLLFAGSNTHTFINPIVPVLKKLKVVI